MQQGRGILFAGIAVAIMFLTVFFVQQGEHVKRKAFFQNTDFTIPADVLQNYFSVEQMGYGYSQQKSGVRKMGITVLTHGGLESLIPISAEDALKLNVLNSFLGKRDGVPQTFRVYAEHVIHKAQALINTKYVLFERDNGPCPARFHSPDEETCLSTVDAVAVCMVFAQTHMPLLFANKYLFSEEYWGSIFTLHT